MVQQRRYGFSPLGWLLAATLVLAIVLGGSTRPGALSDTLLQLASLPLMLMALLRITDADVPARIRWAALACTVPFLIAAIHLVPLPPSLWALTTSRDVITQALTVNGAPTRWMPLSLDSNATLISLLSLIPAATIFLATLMLTRVERRHASLVLIGIGLVSVVLAILQVAQGPTSALRPFPVTNPGEAVGFFANRNHFAALTYVLLLFAALWATNTNQGGQPGRPRSKAEMAQSTISLLGWFTVLVILLAAAALTKSRAGLILSIVALLGAFLLAMAVRKSNDQTSSPWILTAAILGALMISGQFVLPRIFERFSTDPLADSRVAFARTTYKAALAHMPFGTGMGTFVPVFAGVEQLKDTTQNIYANRAHNDYLEFWLETGAVGPVIVAVFILWLIGRCWAATRSPDETLAPVDMAIVRASLMAIVLLGVHSLVDYPLRTSALLATMAFCCALQIRPAFEGGFMGQSAPMAAKPPVTSKKKKSRGNTQALPRANSSPLVSPIPDPVAASAKPRALWGEKTDWPKEWTSTGEKPAKTQVNKAEPQPSSDWWKKPPGQT